jgi:VWFA-related protein
MALVSSRKFAVRASALASMTALLLVTAGTSTGARAVQATARKLYVSVLDKAGAPVKDMTAADFEVKENGKVQTITVQPASNPLRVALIVSDGAMGGYQNASAVLINKFLRSGEIRVVEVGEQPNMATDFTSDSAKLTAAVQTLTRRSANRRNGQVLEAVAATAKDIAAEGKRPVIIVMRVGGEASSTMRASNLREALRKAGAKLYVVTPAGATGMGGTMGNAGNAGSESTQNFIEMSQLIEDGARESGGRHDQYTAANLVKTMESLADEILSTYEISYTLAEGKPSDKVSVATKRKDVKIYAPSKIAN